MRPRNSALRALGLMGAALLFTGCASAAERDPIPTPTHLDLAEWDAKSGNGIDLLGTTQARATVLGAVRDAGGLAMQGTFTDASGRSIQVRVSTAEESTLATFTVDDAASTVVQLDGDTFVKPSAAVAQATGLAAEAFSCVAEDHSAVTMWGMLLHPRQTLAELTVDAASVGLPREGRVDLILGTESTQGRLAVQAEGPALPIELSRADTAGSTTLKFGSWGEDPELPKLEPLAAPC